MGLPLRRIVVATNENDVLHCFFESGVYAPRSREEILSTSSPSMDISKASNFERFVFDVVERDAQHLRLLWEEVESAGSIDLSGNDRLQSIVRHRFGFTSGRSTHTLRLQTIQDVFKKYGVVIDTHTADAMAVAMAYRAKQRQLVAGRRDASRDLCGKCADDSAEEHLVVVETAQAAKFEESIAESFNQVCFLYGCLCSLRLCSRCFLLFYFDLLHLLCADIARLLRR